MYIRIKARAGCVCDNFFIICDFLKIKSHFVQACIELISISLQGSLPFLMDTINSQDVPTKVISIAYMNRCRNTSLMTMETLNFVCLPRSENLIPSLNKEKNGQKMTIQSFWRHWNFMGVRGGVLKVIKHFYVAHNV